jgi:decaprenylphospho-beta-D-ribofuranose 2-oxidase
VLTPEHPGQVEEQVRGAGGGVLARGAGCSYGDAAQLDGGTVIDTTQLRRILWVDAERRLVRAQAGATIARLMAALADHGMALPVVPGTRYPTLAGAIASDIHGKNHHVDGAFARHVVSIRICTPADGLVEVTPESDPDLFYGTLGGMGLTGVIVEATIRAMPLPTPWVADDIDRTDNLEQTLELTVPDEPRRYAVAWLDMLADGPSYGRAIVSRADLMAGPPEGKEARTSAYPGELISSLRLRVPDRFPRGALLPGAVRAHNAARWKLAPRRAREHPTPIVPYFFPLDALVDWNRAYGPDGFLQYQFAMPLGHDEELRRCFDLLRGMPVYLAVFKRFGEQFGGPLSFPLAGWTLAVDLPARAPGLRERLAAIDDVVAAAGGRVYLTKDVRMAREHLEVMYPRLGEFRALRERVDPHGVLRSDLALRLGLAEPAA